MRRNDINIFIYENGQQEPQAAKEVLSRLPWICLFEIIEEADTYQNSEHEFCQVCRQMDQESDCTIIMQLEVLNFFNKSFSGH